MNRLESIKERLENVNTKKGMELFHARNTFSTHAEDDIEYLLQRLERYEKALLSATKALEEIWDDDGLLQTHIDAINEGKEALKE